MCLRLCEPDLVRLGRNGGLPRPDRDEVVKTNRCRSSCELFACACTGCSSRSGLMATQCSLPPMSIPAASGCTTSSAFQSTFGRGGPAFLLVLRLSAHLFSSFVVSYLSARNGSDNVQDSPTRSHVGLSARTRPSMQGIERNRSHADARV